MDLWALVLSQAWVDLDLLVEEMVVDLDAAHLATMLRINWPSNSKSTNSSRPVVLPKKLNRWVDIRETLLLGRACMTMYRNQIWAVVWDEVVEGEVVIEVVKHRVQDLKLRRLPMRLRDRRMLASQAPTIVEEDRGEGTGAFTLMPGMVEEWNAEPCIVACGSSVWHL